MESLSSRIYESKNIDRLSKGLNLSTREATTLNNSIMDLKIDGTITDDQKKKLALLANTYKVDPDALESIIELDMILEVKKVRVKRQHTEQHPEVNVGEQGSVRDRVVVKLFDEENHRMTLKEFNQMMEGLQEELGHTPSKAWPYRNKHLVRIRTVKGSKIIELTRAGRNLATKIKNTKPL